LTYVVGGAPITTKGERDRNRERERERKGGKERLTRCTHAVVAHTCARRERERERERERKTYLAGGKERGAGRVEARTGHVQAFSAEHWHTHTHTHQDW
jgi:hypothetical protein